MTESWKNVVPERDVTLYDLSTKYATIVTVTETIEYLRGFALKAAE
jgi:hypothetical protein